MKGPEFPIVSNICIFMADALRWDYLPESVRNQGVTVKTIAASLSTHTSVPTMLTGLYPHRHQVLSWQDRLPSTKHLLNLPDLRAGYYQPGQDAEQDGTFSILNIDNRTPLDELLQGTEDWIYFERHHGGHAPFNAIQPWEGSWDDWVNKYAGNIELYQTDYSRAVEATVEDFNSRINRIAEEDQLDDTLIVFVSDHGEYLGDGGFLGHSVPLRPEGVYVPTVFIHPDLPSGVEIDGIMRHIDLYPTILDALNRDVPEFVDGQSIATGLPQHGYSTAIGNLYVRGNVYPIWRERGLWDESGGFVFPDVNIIERVGTIGYYTLLNKWSRRHHLRRKSLHELFSSIHPYVSNARKYGEPGFEQKFAYERINTVKTKSPFTDRNEQELEQDTKDHLQDLGYL